MLSRARVVWLCGALLLGGCAAAQPATPPAGVNCERSCLEIWDSCKKTCQRAVDPTGSIRGSTATCAQVCDADKETCDLGCLRGRAAPPK